MTNERIVYDPPEVQRLLHTHLGTSRAAHQLPPLLSFHLSKSQTSRWNCATLSKHAMPTSFLELPREIRDIIYELTLVSPSGYVAPIAKKPSRVVRFSLHSNSRTQRDIESANFIVTDEEVLSLSLPRTCRQIWQETRSTFWSSNTLRFPDPPSMKRTLKSMGQTASRRIESISMGMDIETCKDLRKCCALLSSRARRGSFKKLQLEIDEYALNELVYWKEGSDNADPGTFKEYDEILGMLRASATERSYQRVIRVNSYRKNSDVPLSIVAMREALFRDLHLAFGGKMYFNNELWWEEYKQVRCSH